MESLETVLLRQSETCREAMDRAFVRWERYNGAFGKEKLAEKAKKDMDMWEQRMFDADFHLQKLRDSPPQGAQQ